MDEELAAIGEQRKAWITAINRNDATGFVAVLADDVVWLPSMESALCGKQTVQAWLERPFAELDYDYQVSEIRVRIAGKWAVEKANFITKARKNRSGAAMPIHRGSYTLVWRKEPSGVWLIERYIDHSADFTEVD